MPREQELMDLILDTARQDARIRAVVLGGSRANPNAPHDRFQDFDIVYLVEEVAPFRDSPGWIDRFGPRLMLQRPEHMRAPLGDGRETYLMLFEDHSRLDLQLMPLSLIHLVARDSDSILLLDKDRRFAPLPPAGDADYRVRPPLPLEYSSCCNNFWWCSQNVAKGIWRGELLYAAGMLNNILREELLFMLCWLAGTRHRFAVSPGKYHKYLPRFLTQAELSAYAATYPQLEAAALWEALFAMCRLFRSAGQAVGAALGQPYPEADDAAMTGYLEQVRSLPQE